MPSPVGLLLGSKSDWRVGSQLGSGACGSVHELDRIGSSSSSSTSKKKGATIRSYAVKVAPVPPPRANAKTGKKRKKTAEERNADLILHEHTLYQNVLNDLRGSVVPEVPLAGIDKGAPPGYGDVDGYRFLVMERMDCPLANAIPSLVRHALAGGGSSSSSGRRKTGAITIPLGKVACAMLSHLESIHGVDLIFVDVKADNFMLSRSTSSSSSARASSNDDGVADRVRIIDFGLTESRIDASTGRHRENAGSKFAGTPIYASINALEGNTPSRRDDLEALGYVVTEMVLKALSEASGSSSSSSSSSGRRKKGTSSSSSSGLLPWSAGKSDEEILRIKASEVEGAEGSDLFASLAAGGNAAASGALREYFDTVRGLGYASKPDYEGLRRILSRLDVRVDAVAPAAAAGGGKQKVRDEGEKKRAATKSSSKKSAAASTARPRRSAAGKGRGKGERSSDEDDDDDVVIVDDESVDDEDSPSNKKRRSTRTGAAASATTEKQNARRGRSREARYDEDVPAADVVTGRGKRRTGRAASRKTTHIEDDEDDDSSAGGVEDMDWEVVHDENDAPVQQEGEASLRLLVASGPHDGESVLLGGDYADAVTVGRCPGTKRAGSSFALGRDETASGSHAKFALHSSARAKTLSVKVTDLKSQNGTLVNGSSLPKGGSRQAFIGDKIEIGNSTLVVKRA